jgi:hypothetical protein
MCADYELSKLCSILTADGLEEPVAVSNEALELVDVAPGAHGLAVSLVVDPEHTIPCRGQPDPTCCQKTVSPIVNTHGIKQFSK